MKNENTKTATGDLQNYSLSTWDLNFGHSFSAFGFHKLSAVGLQKLNALKAKLTSQLTAEAAGLLSAHTVQLAVNEADSLAATTQFPALFLPELAEEKVRNALAWQARQWAMQGQTLAFAA